METDDIAELIQGLEQGPVWDRRRCAEALGKTGDARAAAPLCRALTNRRMRDVAGRALLNLGELAILPLCEALKNQGPAVRRWAVALLGQIQDRRSVLPLCRALKDSDTAVRCRAAQLLGERREARAVPPLCYALTHNDWWLRSAAITALGKIGDARAIVPLIHVLKSGDWETPHEAAEALVKIGDPRAALPLVEALKDEDSDVRGRAAEVLGKVGDRRAILPLCDALREGSIEAAEVLGGIAGRDPAPELLTALPLLHQQILSRSFDTYKEWQTLRTAIRRIEAATAWTMSLPVAAAAPLPSVDSLPLPAAVPLPSAEDLPMPAGPPTTAPDCLPVPAAAPDAHATNLGGPPDHTRANRDAWWQRRRQAFRRLLQRH